MKTKLFQTVFVALFLSIFVSCGETAQQVEHQQSQNSVGDEEDQTLEAMAALSLAEDLELEGESEELSEESEALVSEMSEEDMEESIQSRAAEIIAKFDVDGDGALNEEELQALHQAKKERFKSRVDLNKDGIIDANELFAFKMQMKKKMQRAKKRFQGKFQDKRPLLCGKVVHLEIKLSIDSEAEHKPFLLRMQKKCLAPMISQPQFRKPPRMHICMVIKNLEEQDLLESHPDADFLLGVKEVCLEKKAELEAAQDQQEEVSDESQEAVDSEES